MTTANMQMQRMSSLKPREVGIRKTALVRNKTISRGNTFNFTNLKPCEVGSRKAWLVRNKNGLARQYIKVNALKFTNVFRSSTGIHASVEFLTPGAQ
jgi:hypothetical protein